MERKTNDNVRSTSKFPEENVRVEDKIETFPGLKVEYLSRLSRLNDTIPLDKATHVQSEDEYLNKETNKSQHSTKAFVIQKLKPAILRRSSNPSVRKSFNVTPSATTSSQIKKLKNLPQNHNSVYSSVSFNANKLGIIRLQKSVILPTVPISISSRIPSSTSNKSATIDQDKTKEPL